MGGKWIYKNFKNTISKTHEAPIWFNSETLFNSESHSQPVPSSRRRHDSPPHPAQPHAKSPEPAQNCTPSPTLRDSAPFECLHRSRPPSASPQPSLQPQPSGSTAPADR